MLAHCECSFRDLSDVLPPLSWTENTEQSISISRQSAGWEKHLQKQLNNPISGHLVLADLLNSEVCLRAWCSPDCNRLGKSWNTESLSPLDDKTASSKNWDIWYVLLYILWHSCECHMKWGHVLFHASLSMAPRVFHLCRNPCRCAVHSRRKKFSLSIN